MCIYGVQYMYTVTCTSTVRVPVHIPYSYASTVLSTCKVAVATCTGILSTNLTESTRVRTVLPVSRSITLQAYVRRTSTFCTGRTLYSIQWLYCITVSRVQYCIASTVYMQL